MRKASVTPSIVAGVVCGNYGWWEACESIDAGSLDPFGERGANVNFLVTNDLRDPIGGSLSHRSSLCRIRPLPHGG